MADLKKCPFCGGEAFIISTGNYFPKKYYRVVCNNICVMQGRLYDTQEEAVEAWNRRADGRID